MKYYLLLFTIFAFCSSSKTTNSEQEKYKVLSKFIVYDELTSSEITHCIDDTVKTFNNMDTYGCSFLLDKTIFQILDKIVIDEFGNLKEYWDYKPMGPITYNLDELQSDKLLASYLEIDKINIQWFNDTIIDSGDTLTIEKTYEKERLILVKNKSKIIPKNQRFIYHYK